jgi:hypothetical protein
MVRKSARMRTREGSASAWKSSAIGKGELTRSGYKDFFICVNEAGGGRSHIFSRSGFPIARAPTPLYIRALA